MDAKIGDWVVTPRTGKTVEVNALWYNAVRIMADFARQLNRQGNDYSGLADRLQSSFNRFWNEDSGYCYDVIDAPESSHDASLRPNQLLAVSLPHSPLAPSQQRAIVDVCGRRLLTSLGMRSLAPGNLGYSGRYRGDVIARDTAYHQGTVWAWLIGPFIEAHLRVYHDPEQARAFLQPFVHHLAEYGVGSICEVAEGDPPHLPRGCIAQAWSVAEVLRAWTLIVKEGS